MAEMNCGASGKDPGVTGQCCKKNCQGQIQVQASVQARPQGQTCCRPVCPPPAPGGRRLRISWYVSAGRNCLRDPSRYGPGLRDVSGNGSVPAGADEADQRGQLCCG